MINKSEIRGEIEVIESFLLRGIRVSNSNDEGSIIRYSVLYLFQDFLPHFLLLDDSHYLNYLLVMSKDCALSYSDY